MTNKPNLTLIDMKPLDDLPKEAYGDFKEFILGGCLKPSVALRKVMEKYECNEVHVTSVVHLLEYAYPDIDIGRQGFRFKIVDSAYPNSDPQQFSDNDFDDGIEELLSLPPVTW